MLKHFINSNTVITLVQNFSDQFLPNLPVAGAYLSADT